MDKDKTFGRYQGMNESVKSITVLTAICLIVAIILSGVNYVTAPVIAENQANKANESLIVVLPDAESFEEIAIPEGSPETVTGVYKDTAGTGYAVTVSTSSQYSSSDMQFTIGVGSDGKIVNISLTNYAESKDFGTDTYPQSYIGQDSALSGVDTVAGVTYSSAAFKNAVADAFTVLLSVSDISAGEKTDEQIASELAQQVFPYACNSAGICSLSASAESYDGISALYETENDTGYIATADDNAETVFMTFDAFGAAISVYDSQAQELDSAEYSAQLESASAVVAGLVQQKQDKIITRIGKMIDGAQVTPLTLSVRSSVSSAYSVTAPDGSYTAFVAQPYGYGGPVEIIYILTSDGEISRFKVISHNETEYFGEAVAESVYAEKQEGANITSPSEDDILISGCTFTSNAVRTAYDDVAEAFESLGAVE